MILRRSLAVLLFGATLVFVPSALAHGHAASHPAKGPRCTKHGVTTNRAGHANCGLHKGQPQPPVTSGTGDEPPTTSTGDDPSGDDSATGVAATGDQSATGDDQGDDSPGDNAQ